MQTIILYGSQYGTTKRYADRLAEQTGLPAVSYESAGDLSRYTQVVYLGGLYAGGVKGLKQTVKKLPAGVRLILVTVGLADVQDKQNVENIRRSVRQQVPADVLQNAEIFHLRGGIDYSTLSFTHKTMMKLLYNHARKLPPEKQTAETRAMIETFGTQVDFVDFASLRPIADAMQVESER